MTALDRYLVELHRPPRGWKELQHVAAIARAAAEQLRREGTQVRFLRSIFVPEDGNCFFLYEAESREAVHRAATAAGIRLGQFAEPVFAASSTREGATKSFRPTVSPGREMLLRHPMDEPNHREER